MNNTRTMDLKSIVIDLVTLIYYNCIIHFKSIKISQISAYFNSMESGHQTIWMLNKFV